MAQLQNPSLAHASPFTDKQMNRQTERNPCLLDGCTIVSVHACTAPLNTCLVYMQVSVCLVPSGAASVGDCCKWTLTIV